jgi:hypothetical protein
MRFTIERLKERLYYQGDFGVFTWRHRPRSEFASLRAYMTWNARFAGEQAGYQTPGRYRNICIDYHTHQAHRLAWLYVHEEWPEHIDHINGDKSDNRIANLRSVSNAENRKNQATRKDNTSGVQGVVWDKQTGKWTVRINVNSKTLNLGRYAEFEDAVARRKQAEIDFGFHPNHGRAA